MTSTQNGTPLYVFNYQPLDELGNEIRLLTAENIERNLKGKHCRLDHDFSDGAVVVCCTIEHVSLSQPPSYKGLSYCWGDRNDSSAIHLNGVEIYITKNLEAALRELGNHESVCLWVDALCINQSDLVERGRQVLRMADIYKNASETICWLGVETKKTFLAFELIRILSQTDNDFPSTEYEEALKRLYKPSDTHRYDAHWTAFQRLCSRAYWRRVWIIQEIATSRNVWIRCGSQGAIRGDLMTAVLSVPTAAGRSRLSIVSRALSSILGGIVSIDALRGFTQKAKTKSDYISLLNALNRSKEALATISSDKIYGLLAITKDGQDLIPHPDCTLSPGKICTMTTAAIIVASADLDIYVMRQRRPGFHHPGSQNGQKW